MTGGQIGSGVAEIGGPHAGDETYLPGQVPGGVRWQRRKARTRRHLELVALRLFETRGFDSCTVEDVAAAAGVGRRTFFRYFPSKSEVVFSGATDQFAVLRQALDEDTTARDPVELVAAAFRRANDFPPEDNGLLASRIRLIQSVPALREHSGSRFAGWERALAAAVTDRFPEMAGLPADALARASLGVMWAAYAAWLGGGAGTDLPACIDAAFGLLHGGFAVAPHGRPRPGGGSGPAVAADRPPAARAAEGASGGRAAAVS